VRPLSDTPDVLERSLTRFNEISSATRDERQLSLEDRRFLFIQGAQWEGLWGEQFENSIRVQINKVQRGHDKIINDYRANRFMVEYRPVGNDNDDDTAELLNGLMFADMYRSKGQQGLDNAFAEGVGGGMGAWRLCNEYEDESDGDNDHQRIRVEQIADADVRVFFDLDSKLYDKSDAKFAYVLHSMTRPAFKDEFGEDKMATWPENRARANWFDWFRPNVVYVAEYYEVEKVKRERRTYYRTATNEEYKYWAEDVTDEMATYYSDRGFQTRKRMVMRKRVHKWILSGAEVLKDCGFIAGECIPIIPFYGKRVFIDNIERFKGHVRDAKDPARVYNAIISSLVEKSSLSPRELPIFAPEQVEGLQDHWKNMNIERHSYALANPLIDPISGSIVSAGPQSYIKPPDVPPVQAALIQQTGADIAEITNGDDGSMEIKSNVSGEAMDIAAGRIDAKSYVYMDNFKQSVQRFGEVYYSMAKEVYCEEGREVETMDEDGKTEMATLGESYTDPTTKAHVKRYDLSQGRFNVVASVTEATNTRRDKTVRAMNAIAQTLAQLQDFETGKAAMFTAIKSMDGEGLDDFKAYVHKQSVGIGLDEMTEQEKAEAQQNQQPDPQALALQAQAEALTAQAGKLKADTNLSVVKAEETRTKSLLNLANAHKANEEANQPQEQMQPRPLPKIAA
jgi:hypothetical protein